jgi:hypothetical protein
MLSTWPTATGLALRVIQKLLNKGGTRYDCEEHLDQKGKCGTKVLYPRLRHGRRFDNLTVPMIVPKMVTNGGQDPKKQACGHDDDCPGSTSVPAS